MKKHKLILILGMLVSASLTAQTKYKDVSIGLHFGDKAYSGEYGSEFFATSGTHAAGGISVGKYLTPSVDAFLYVSYGRIDMGHEEREFFKNDILDINATLKYKFANGKILKEDSRIAPFIFGGIGDAISSADYYPNGNRVDFNFPVGGGIDVRLTDVVSLSLMSSYNYTVSDIYDNWSKFEEFKKNDQFLFNSIGVKFNIPSKDPDKDGITSAADDCPDMAGLGENSGCPVIKEEDKTVMMKAMKGLFFETGSSTIKTESYRVLDGVLNVLSSDPNYKLSIEGHTDNTGSDEINNKLSYERALAAKTYLMDKGIDASRILATGYGSSKPIASNDTEEGRKQNRRVVFSLMY